MEESFASRYGELGEWHWSFPGRERTSRRCVVSHHKRRYTGRTLADAFARAGVELTWSSYFNTLLFPAVAAVRWSRRLLGASGGPPASDVESARPGTLNELLERVFASERHLLGRVRLPAGVSLIAVARRPGAG